MCIEREVECMGDIKRIPYQTSFEEELIQRYRILLQELIKSFDINKSFKIHTRKISLNSLLEFLISEYTDDELINIGKWNKEQRSKNVKENRRMVNTTFKQEVYDRIKALGAIAMIPENNIIEGVMKQYTNNELINYLLELKLIQKKEK